MPALLKTQFQARVVFLGYVDDRQTTLRAEPVTEAKLTWDGIEGECHGGLTRPSCSRVLSQFPKNTEIRNVRQLSILSSEQLVEVAETLNLEHLDPTLLGASLVIEGIPDWTHVPPSSRLQSQSGATLVIDMENRPCIYPAKEIEHDHAGHGKAFKAAAKGKRGVTAWVERPGTLTLNEVLTLHVPDQPTWAHLDAARER